MTAEDPNTPITRWQGPAESSRNSQPRRIARLALKELRETLRDRRTIITLLLMPVLVYPLLSIFFQRFLLSSFRGGPDLGLIIGVETPQDFGIVSAVLAHGAELLETRQEDLS